MKNPPDAQTVLSPVLTQVLATHHGSGPCHLLVALSGGLDSVVLLHALAQLRTTQSLSLSAAHIHHGLSPYADDWAAHCSSVCERLQVPFSVVQVQVDLQSGAGVEAAARQARYAALQQTRETVQADWIVTAHHEQDQAETLLLQLLRGAGLRGLSAMSAVDTARQLLRPLLSVSKSTLEAYAQQHALQWVEDESNLDRRFDRNFLRQEALPLLRQRYPHLDQTLSRSSQHLADAQALLDVLATQDLAQCDVREEWLGQSISMAALLALGERRGKNLLRGWFQQRQLAMPSTERLEDYWQQLVNVKPHRYLHLPLEAASGAQRAYLHHYQQRLYCVRKPTALPASPFIWKGERTQVWGAWQVQMSVQKGKGIALARLGVSPAAITLHRRYAQPLLPAEGLHLVLHARAGGELLQPDAKRPRRELKVLFQQAAVPPWQRAYYPLASVEIAGEPAHRTLVALTGLAVDAAWQPGRNAYGLVINLTPRDEASSH